MKNIIIASASAVAVAAGIAAYFMNRRKATDENDDMHTLRGRKAHTHLTKAFSNAKARNVLPING